MNNAIWVTRSIAVWAFLFACGAMAQVIEGVAEKKLIEPWERATVVVMLLAESTKGSGSAQRRAQLESNLAQFDETLAPLQSQQENVAIKIASTPSFAYDAAQRSLEMAALVSAIVERFDLLSADAALRERPEVSAARESMDGLRQVLQEKTRFERDVMQAIGSGGKNVIQALAGRWWNGAESIRSLRDSIAQVRQELVATGK